MWILRAALLWTLCACNQVAVMDGVLDLPPQPTEGPPLFVQVQAARSALPFETDWGGATSLASVSLGPTQQTYEFSLSTRSPDTDLHVRVRFCRDRSCTFVPLLGEDAIPDPVSEVRYVIERPFYIRARSPAVTMWQASVADVPRCQTCDGGVDCGLGECIEGVCRVESGCVAAAQGGCEPAAAPRPTVECFVDKCNIACGTVAGTPSAGYCEVSSRGERIHFCE